MEGAIIAPSMPFSIACRLCYFFGGGLFAGAGGGELFTGGGGGFDFMRWMSEPPRICMVFPCTFVPEDVFTL
jgi:hypothetical protein